MRRKLTARDLLPSQQDFENADCPYVEPRRCGYADSEPGESGHKWVVFNRAAVEAAHGAITDETAEQIAGNLTGWAQSWSGAGRGFASEPTIRVFKRNILIKQFTGLDI